MEYEIIQEPNPFCCFGVCSENSIDDQSKLPYWSYKSRFLYFFTNLLFLICCFVTVLQFTSNNLEYIKKQLPAYLMKYETNPIVDIRLSTSNYCSEFSNSSTHYWQPAFMYHFVGIYDGCDCSHITYRVRYKSGKRTSYRTVRKPFYKRKCTSSEISQKCNNYNSSQPEKLITEFGLNKQFCVQKLKNYSFIEFMQQNMKCKADQKQCGSESNYFCVPIGSQCPLIDIDLNLVTAGSSGNQRRLDDHNNNSTLYLIDTKVSQGYSICRNQFDQKRNIMVYSTDQNRHVGFHLYRGSFVDCIPYYDPFYRKLDQFKGISEYELFRKQINSSMQSTLPKNSAKYGQIMSTKAEFYFYFYVRNMEYHNLIPICAKSFLNLKQGDFKISETIRIYFIVHFSIQFLFYFINLKCYCSGGWCNQMMKEGKFDRIRVLWQMIFKIPALILLIYATVKYSIAVSDIYNIETNRCTVDLSELNTLGFCFSNLQLMHCVQLLLLILTIIVDVVTFKYMSFYPLITKRSKKDIELELESKKHLIND